MNSDPTYRMLEAKSTTFIYRDSINQNTSITRKNFLKTHFPTTSLTYSKNFGKTELLAFPITGKEIKSPNLN